MGVTRLPLSASTSFLGKGLLPKVDAATGSGCCRPGTGRTISALFPFVTEGLDLFPTIETAASASSGTAALLAGEEASCATGSVAAAKAMLIGAGVRGTLASGACIASLAGNGSHVAHNIRTPEIAPLTDVPVLLSSTPSWEKKPWRRGPTPRDSHNPGWGFHRGRSHHRSKVGMGPTTEMVSMGRSPPLAASE